MIKRHQQGQYCTSEAWPSLLYCTPSLFSQLQLLRSYSHQNTLSVYVSLPLISPAELSLSLSRTESWLSRRSRSPTPSSRWTVRYLSLSPSLEHLVCFICYRLFDLRAPGNQIKIWSFFSRSLDFESLSFRSEKKKLSFRGNESDYFFRFEKIPIFSYLEKASGLLSDSWDTQ